MLRDCPEIGAGAGGGGRGVKAVEGNRSPSPGGITARLDEHERALRRWVCPLDGGLAGMRKISKSGCDFLWQEVGDKWLMPQDCPEIGGGGGEVGIAAGTGDEGRDVSFVPDGTGVLAVRSTHRWKRWAIIGRPQGTSAAGTISGVAEMAKNSETWGGFVLHEIGGQSVRARQCPEFVPGAGPASSATPRRYLPARSGEDTAVGQKGILDLDLTHDLDRSGPARTFKENSSEWVWTAISPSRRATLRLPFGIPPGCFLKKRDKRGNSWCIGGVNKKG